MNIIKVILVLFCFALVYSCTSDNKSNNAAPTTKDIEKAIPKEKDNIDYKALFEIANQESLEIYNGREQQLLQAENIGILNAGSFLKALIGIAEKGVNRKIISGDKYGISGNDNLAYFIVLEENLPDDSIHSDIRFFEMRKGEKSWNLSAVSSVWKCYPGRGHQDFSTERCN